MPTDNIPDKPTSKPQRLPPGQPVAPRSRSVAPPISQLGLSNVGPDRDMKPLLFDPEWYLEQNADVAKAKLDPVQHYLEYGAAEGRNPNALFDTKAYLAANADVRGSPLNPFLHFVLYGFREGRDPFPPLRKPPVKEPGEARDTAISALPPVDPPTEEKLRQTLLNAMFATSAEAGENDNRKGEAIAAPAKVPAKPSRRSRPGTGKKT